MLIIIGCLTLCAMVLETTLPPTPFAPDWFAALLVFATARFRSPASIGLAALIGFCADAVSSSHFGVQMFWAIAVVTVMNQFQRSSDSRSSQRSNSARKLALTVVVVVVAWRVTSAGTDGLLAGRLQMNAIATNAALSALTTTVLVVVIGSLCPSPVRLERRIQL